MEELPERFAGDERAESLRARFEQTQLHQLLQIESVHVAPDLVVFRMPVAPGAFNSSGNLHGGAIATLVDVSAGTAAALGSGFQPGLNTIVTADLHVRYLGRPHGDWVRAESRVLRAGRQLVVVECRVLDDDDRVIAAADFSSMVVPLRQPLKPSTGGDPGQPDL